MGHSCESKQRHGDDREHTVWGRRKINLFRTDDLYWGATKDLVIGVRCNSNGCKCWPSSTFKDKKARKVLKKSNKNREMPIHLCIKDISFGKMELRSFLGKLSLSMTGGEFRDRTRKSRIRHLFQSSKGNSSYLSDCPSPKVLQRPVTPPLTEHLVINFLNVWQM